MAPFCYLNGTILPVSEAKIGVYDIGILRGFAIYEAMVTANRKIFMFSDHMARFHASTERVHLKIPISDAEIEKVIHELVQKNLPQGEAIIRFIITGGQAIGGIDYDHDTSTFYILVEPYVRLDQKLFDEGCSVTVFEHLRQFPESKTTNYIQAVLLQDARKQAGALEVLYTWQGKMLECATSNMFIVKDGKIITPKENILFGITRKVTIDLAKKEFPLEERDVSVDEMYAADEVFLVSSFKDVMPVVKIGDRTIADGKPGPVTRKVMQLFHDFVTSY